MQWIALLLGIATSVGGQTLLKAGAGAPSIAQQLFDWRTIAGLAVYGVSAALYILALRRIPLSVALPCTALSYFVVAAIGYYHFGEAMGLQKLAALAVIGLGVLMLATA